MSGAEVHRKINVEMTSPRRQRLEFFHKWAKKRNANPNGNSTAFVQ
jgi:hypothetical protein